MLAATRKPVPLPPEDDEEEVVPQAAPEVSFPEIGDEEEPQEEQGPEEDDESNPLVALAKSLGIPKELIRLREWADMPNVAADPSIDDQTLREIASQVADHYDIDKNSRSDWEEAAKAGISLEDAMKECITRGWTGFKSDWYKKEKVSK